MKKYKSKTTIIALCGKGGVGKTSISAIITKILSANKQNRILAIDADPAVGLALALGFKVNKTIDDIRNNLIEKIESGKGGDKQAIISMLDYEVFDAIEEKENLAFLAIGRPETDGCYCQVNEFLKDIVKSVANNFDYVIIDGEAGIEQVNRRVMERVTHLVLVSDISQKGLNVAKTILEVSEGSVKYNDSGLILNRVRDESEKNRIDIPPELNLIGWIVEDNNIRDFDIRGQSFLELPESGAVESISRSLNKLLD